MKRRRSYCGGVFALGFMFLLLAACSGGNEITTGPENTQAEAAPTAVVTTAPAVAPPAPTPTPLPATAPTPTALVVPDATAVPESTATSVALTPTPESGAPVEATTSIPAATTAPQPTAPPISGSQAVLAANGAEVYTLNCARCHSENGLGTAQYSATLIGVGGAYSTASMIAELTTGHPVTFGFANKLSEEEIASVVAYVKATFP